MSVLVHCNSLISEMTVISGVLLVYYRIPSKFNVPKVRAYCSASDRLICKYFLGVCRDSHWFEVYLKFIEIDDHFFRMNVHFLRFSSF